MGDLPASEEGKPAEVDSAVTSESKEEPLLAEESVPSQVKEIQKKKILMSGASGLVGKALRRSLADLGHGVVRLVRHKADEDKKLLDEFCWEPSTGELDPRAFVGVDQVIHLSGAGIADRLWTKKYKKILLDSRVQSTRTLVQAISKLPKDELPELFIMASGVNYYANNGEAYAEEASGKGTGFLADLVADWEAEAKPLEDLGIRVVYLRLGAVMAKEGGVLAKNLPIFSFGLGGRLASGKQSFPWVSIRDVQGIIAAVSQEDSYRGVINCVAPELTDNKTYTKSLADHLGIWAFCHAPESMIKMLPGEMAEEILLVNLAVRPKVLIEAEYPFQDPNIEACLSHILL